MRSRKIEFLFHIRGDVFILIYFLAKILIHNLNNFHKVKRKNCNKLGFLVQNLWGCRKMSHVCLGCRPQDFVGCIKVIGLLHLTIFVGLYRCAEGATIVSWMYPSGRASGYYTWGLRFKSRQGDIMGLLPAIDTTGRKIRRCDRRKSTTQGLTGGGGMPSTTKPMIMRLTRRE